MKTNLENAAFAAISSMAEDIIAGNTADNQKEQDGHAPTKVIGMNKADLNKDAANDLYLAENAKALVEEGFRDAARSDCNRESFGAKLELIKTRYLTWCRNHRELFADRIHEIIDEYKSLILRNDNKLKALDAQINDMEEQEASLRTEIQEVVNRNYKAADIIKLAANVAVLLALGLWVSLYYGSAFTLTQISANDMIDGGSGEVIRLFSIQNMVKGWPLALFPLAAGTIAGLLRKNTWTFAAEMATFLAMDVFLSLTVEQKIGEGFAMMDIPYSFDWNRFMLIVMYGFVASLFFCESSNRLGQAILLNEYNTKRTAAKEAEERLHKLGERMDAVRRERNTAYEDRIAAEDALKRVEEKDVYVYWYDGPTLLGLFNNYFEGWARFLSSCPDREDSDEALREARETIRRTAEE